MKPNEAQPLSKSTRVVRWLYGASMAAGFPLWFFVSFTLVVWVWVSIRPLPDIGPEEFPSPSAMQTGVMRVASLLFFVIYPAAFFEAHRITRQPWVVFAAMLLPVLMLCFAAYHFPITEPNSVERSWLIYLGALALVLTAGTVAAFVAMRRHHRFGIAEGKREP